MQRIQSPQELQQLCQEWKKQGLCVALVPTMGYYHAGHASLMARARSLADRVVVSLFVNPTQFGPTEDLESYPRDLERDAAIAAEQGCDVLFTPEAESMFPPAHATWVEVPALAGTMCGLQRPIHFRGVCTVVLKLFMLVQPDIACFGEKDWQQLAIIRKMAADLFLPVDIVGCPIVRDSDGLALSSRNVYLTSEERAVAPQLHAALKMAEQRVQAGERNAVTLQQNITDYLAQHLPTGQIDYVVCVDPVLLAPLEQIDTQVLCALAVRLGKARLIDNICISCAK